MPAAAPAAVDAANGDVDCTASCKCSVLSMQSKNTKVQ